MFLGIDLGTSEVKVLLLDDRHTVVGTAGRALALSRPQPQWSEQTPADWWAATEAAVAVLAAAHPQAMAAVQAIGLSGQMHGAVLLDGHGQVLRPAILWNDVRSGAACQALEAAVPGLRAITGNRAIPGFTAPKLWWVREHEPDVFARTARVLLPKDWLRLQMTGEAVSDLSDASGTLWLDVGGRCWSAELLAACGLTERHMPRLVEGSRIGGHLSADVARRWGLPTGTPVAGGGGDNAASAVGIGAVTAGQGFVSLGTSGVVFLCGDRFRPNPERAVHAFCHAIPGTWHQMSVSLNCGSALRWARELVRAADEAALLAPVDTMPAARRERAPLFLPYLGGERSPHNDPHAQGVLFGLQAGHDGDDVAYAVLEGVSLALLDGWLSLDRAAPPPAALSLVGGGARNGRWAQLLASALGVTLHTHPGGEAGGALGAARLGWLAVGGSPAQVCRPPPVARVFEPDATERALLLARHQRFTALYPALRDQFIGA